MLNSIVLVGKLNKITKKENGVIFEVKVERNYKDENGENVYDNILCIYPNLNEREEYKFIELGCAIAVRGSLRVEQDGYYVHCKNVSYLSKEGVENGNN